MKKNVWLVIFVFCVVIFFSNNLWAGAKKTGKWEIEAQYGIWTMRPALKVIDDQEWNISGEKNIGVALRLKPKQSFSLGLVYQKINGQYDFFNPGFMEYIPYEIMWINDKQVKVVNILSEEAEKISIAGEMVVIDMRWEIASTWRVHPYFTLGFGVIFHDISENYHYSRTAIDINGKHILMDEDNEGWDLEDFPSALPVLELKFGLKFEIIKKKLALGIEGGFMDGLVYAGTLNFRF
jgi:hypothetical protein